MGSCFLIKTAFSADLTKVNVVRFFGIAAKDQLYKKPTPTKDQQGVPTKDQHLQKTYFTKDQHLQKTITYKKS